MEEFAVTLTPEMVGLAGIVGVLLQFAKKIEALNKIKAWFPYIAIAVAYGLCTVSGIEDPIMPSVLIGVVASGGYDLVRAPTK